MNRFAIALLILLTSLPAPVQGELTLDTDWSQAYFTRIDASFPDGDYHAR